MQAYRGEYGAYPGASRLFHEGEPCGCRRYARQGKAWHDQDEHGGVRADDSGGEYVACPACGLDGVKAPQGGVVALAQEKYGQAGAAAEQYAENGGECGQGTPVGDDGAQAGEPVRKKREKWMIRFMGQVFAGCRPDGVPCQAAGVSCRWVSCRLRGLTAGVPSWRQGGHRACGPVRAAS